VQKVFHLNGGSLACKWWKDALIKLRKIFSNVGCLLLNIRKKKPWNA
jgi:hypothetical protein